MIEVHYMDAKDPEGQVGYISLTDKRVGRTVSVECHPKSDMIPCKWIVLDFDEGGRFVGIEFLDHAKQAIPEELNPQPYGDEEKE